MINNNSSFISVIVPVFNAERYLDRCISSIISQSYKNLEIILVNDGSCDSSLSICQEYEKKDQRIKVFDKPNEGVSSARNLGIRKCTGDYIMLLDSDDWWSIDMCDTMMNIITTQNADCVVCGLNQTSGNIWAPEKYCIYQTREEIQKDFVYWLNTELLSSSVNKIYKRKKIVNLYPEDMSFGEDLLFCLNYLKECDRIVFIQDALYNHEVYNCGSLTHTFDSNRFSNIEEIQKNIIMFGGQVSKGIPELYSKYINDAILLIRRCMASCDMTYISKKQLLEQWFKHAYLRHLDFLQYNLIWKNKILLFFLKIRFFRCIYILVNIKNLLHLKSFH